MHRQLGLQQQEEAWESQLPRVAQLLLLLAQPPVTPDQQVLSLRWANLVSVLIPEGLLSSSSSRVGRAPPKISALGSATHGVDTGWTFDWLTVHLTGLLTAPMAYASHMKGVPVCVSQ